LIFGRGAIIVSLEKPGILFPKKWILIECIAAGCDCSWVMVSLSKIDSEIAQRTGAIAAPAPAVKGRGWLLPLILYSLGHFSVDLYQGGLGALLPVVQSHFGLSFTQLGLVGGALACSSSLFQPLYGYLSDRFDSRLFSALGPAVAAVFISSLIWSHGFGGLLLMVTAGGVGIAAFHPQAAANAVVEMTSNRGHAMSIFLVAGTLGVACGPLLFAVLLDHGGLSFARAGVVPGAIVSLLLLALLKPPRARPQPQTSFDWAAFRVVWKPMTLLFLMVLIRSIVQATFGQFLPLYLHDVKHYTLSQASVSLSLYLAAGAIGGLAGGNLADRFGGRLVILISMTGSVPFFVLFLLASGAWSVAGLFLGGLVLMFTVPVNIIMAQKLAPTQSGTVSALMMGFAWGSAGMIFIPLTGWIADIWSLQWAFAGLIAFPVLGFLLGLKLPRQLSS
jgi:FSR family fosmidomycin resistance protein-like MFS transporter